MEYKLYRGYILGPGYQDPAHDIYEVSIYLHKEDVEADNAWHTSESEWEAQLWLDGGPIDGTATQQDVDELNLRARGTERNRMKEGIRLLVVDRNGRQLIAIELDDWNAYDYDSQRELGQAIAEGLPDEAYK